MPLDPTKLDPTKIRRKGSATRQAALNVIKVPYVEHVPPDVTAQIFWLKNRDPRHWRDAWQIEPTVGAKYILSDKPMSEEEWIRERATLIDVTPDETDEQ